MSGTIGRVIFVCSVFLLPIWKAQRVVSAIKNGNQFRNAQILARLMFRMFFTYGNSQSTTKTSTTFHLEEKKKMNRKGTKRVEKELRTTIVVLRHLNWIVSLSILFIVWNTKHDFQWIAGRFWFTNCEYIGLRFFNRIKWFFGSFFSSHSSFWLLSVS